MKIKENNVIILYKDNKKNSLMLIFPNNTWKCVWVIINNSYLFENGKNLKTKIKYLKIKEDEKLRRGI